MTGSERNGVVAAGNFLVDHVKIIDDYPSQDHLALVAAQKNHNGGGAYNLLRALSALGAKFPLIAEGLVGNDRDGDWVVRDCQRHGIDVAGLSISSDIETSWTDVMSVASTGRRTFFHHPGANDELKVDPTSIVSSNAKVFYLGYLTMLRAMDAIDDAGRTGASYVLEQARAAGVVTVADLVSREHPHFKAIVASAAPYLDYLILNEIEALWLVDRPFDQGDLNYAALEQAGHEILKLGIARAVVIHFAHGAVCVGHNGMSVRQPAVNVPGHEIKSALGAGDAFAAGFVLGLHEARSLQNV